MVYSLSYRRPSRNSSSSSRSRDSLSGAEKQKSINESTISGSSGMSHGIPDALSFDSIIAGGVCPPCTVRDFMNYLKYIELAAENLQFFLWARDYTKRFNELPDSEKALSPEWTNQDFENENQPRAKKPSPQTVAVFKGTGFGSEPPSMVESEKTNPFNDDAKRNGDSFDSDATSIEAKTNHTARAGDAFQTAGLQWAPLSVQPYREEITRIISIYIADNGTRQLNLASKERASLLHALQITTHPSAFRDVLTTVEWSLRCQSHPNFIRWTICNGNPPRVAFARGLGIAGIVGGTVAGIVITLSSAGRAWRVLSLIGFLVGISTLIAAWKGMCVVLHGMHHRHLRPWELFTSDDEPSGYDMKTDSYETIAMNPASNSYEDEPWVAKYEKRNLIRKIFDREVWVQEPALRQIQDTIFVQSLLGAMVLSCVLVGIFCAVPHGNFF